jgi:hypothetical protein
VLNTMLTKIQENKLLFAILAAVLFGLGVYFYGFDATVRTFDKVELPEVTAPVEESALEDAGTPAETADADAAGADEVPDAPEDAGSVEAQDAVVAED